MSASVESLQEVERAVSHMTHHMHADSHDGVALATSSIDHEDSVSEEVMEDIHEEEVEASNDMLHSEHSQPSSEHSDMMGRDGDSSIHLHMGPDGHSLHHHIQPLTPENEDPPIPEPVHHEEVKQSPHSPHNTLQQVHLAPGQLPPPIVPAPPKLTPHEVSLITEAASKPGPNGTFQCTLCNKQFGYKNGLIRHIRLTHVGEKPYECNICHRRFGYKHILMEHQNLHYGHRPYACTLCDKRFAARSNLIQHRTVHKRPFNCSLCNKRFDKEDQLKKHMFAHPQALIHCTLCKFAAANQNDLNKHIMEAHADVLQEGLKRNGDTMSPPQLSPRLDRVTEPITPPSTVGSPQDLSHQQSNSPPNLSMRPMQTSKGHRIDAICNQLSTSVAMTSDDRYPNLSIKKEDNEELVNGDGNVRVQPIDVGYQGIHTSGELPRVSVAAMYTNPTTGLPTGLSPEDLNKVVEEATKAALPGIQEMFSRRTPNSTMSMVMPNYGVPLAIASTGLPHGHPDLPNLLMSPPPTNYGAPGTPFMNQRQQPHLPLPPSTPPENGGKRDQAIQHTAPIPGFPSLEDVLAYYMGQGKLFKCQYCDVMFFERGMYFLHASLHGNSSPWECSICHKICSDKNEFTIHFVNQQHNS